MNAFAKMVSTKSMSLHTILSTRTLVYHAVLTTFACHRLLVSFRNDFQNNPNVLILYWYSLPFIVGVTSWAKWNYSTKLIFVLSFSLILIILQFFIKWFPSKSLWIDLDKNYLNAWNWWLHASKCSNKSQVYYHSVISSNKRTFTSEFLHKTLKPWNGKLF